MIIAALLSFLLGHTPANSAPETCNKVPGVNDIDINDIKRLVSPPCNFKADQLVNALPQEMKDYVVIMKKSASLVKNCVTPKTPRLIYSGPKVIVAVPWNSTTVAACNLAEAIGVLPEPGLHQTIVDFNSPINHVDTTGSRCTRCHTGNFIPSWPKYADWETPNNAPFAGVDDNIKINSPEFQELKELVRLAKRENKISWLGGRMPVFESKIAELETGVIDDENEHGILLMDQDLPFTFINEDFPYGTEGRYGKKHPSYKSRPNFRLGMIINNFNATRVSQIIMNKVPRAEVVDLLKSMNLCTELAETNPDVVKVLELLKKSGLSEKDLILSPVVPTEAKLYNDGNHSSADTIVHELMKTLDLLPPEGLSNNYSAYYQRNSLFGPPRNNGGFWHHCESINQKLKSL